MQGLVSIDPANVPASPHPPVVQIKRVLLDGEEIRESSPNRGLAATAPEFQIPPGAHRYEFQYTGLSLAAPEAIQFRYRLEGLDPDWIEAGTTRSALYSRLPPGHYRFVLMAANRDGIWSGEQPLFQLCVLPAFWQTGLFLSGCFISGAALLVGAGWLVARQRARRRLAELAQAQAVEHERARIARDMHDDLGARLTGLANLGELAMADDQSPAQMKSHLQFLTGRVRELINAVDEAVWTVSPENDSLPNLAAFLSDYTERFVAPSGIAHRLELDAEFPPLPLTAQARHHLLMAAKESLNNAVRHASAKTIRLKIHVHDGWLNVVVSDDGHGFEVSNGRTNGHGLSNLAERMALVRGQAEIKSEVGKGTTVTLSMPMASLMVRH
jgi:signal transduction histidine kinase